MGRDGESRGAGKGQGMERAEWEGIDNVCEL